MKLKAILFDLGGTLLHYHDPQSDDLERHFRRITQVGINQIAEQIAREGGPVLAPDILTPVVDKHIGKAVQAAMVDQRGGSVEQPIRAALEELGIAIDSHRWAALRPHFYEAIDSIVTPRLGVVETLTSLTQAGYSLGLISNTFWAVDLHDKHLAQFGLLNLLPVRVYSCDSQHTKPHPSIFHAALQQMNIGAKNAAYVGDRPDLDVAGAQQAGMQGVLIRSPYYDASSGHGKPDAVIEEIPELPHALQQMESAQ